MHFPDFNACQLGVRNLTDILDIDAKTSSAPEATSDHRIGVRQRCLERKLSATILLLSPSKSITAAL